MEKVKLFLKEVTEEILYNIVYDADEINYKDLSEKFEEKTGYRPMDFFGLGNITAGGWFDFIKGIPGLEGKKTISICDDDISFDSDDDSDDEGETVYKMFNTTYLDENDGNTSSVSVARYREVILIKCVEIMEDDFTNLNDCEDENGNTPLHLIAALPGITYDCYSLVKYLLQAGVDPLHTNNKGQTFLHITFGGFKAESEGDVLSFKNERVAVIKWFVKDRVDLLKMLSDELSQGQITSLAKAQDNKGNTVLHECAFATSFEQLQNEGEIYQNLLSLGASLRISNNSGEVPLHYAFNSKVFKIFLQNGAVCRARNDRDETPVLFISKMSADLAFAQTSASAELADQGFVQTINRRSVSKAVQLMANLASIISESDDARKTALIPDIEGNTAIHIVLIAMRIGSYHSHDLFIFNFLFLQLPLVDLLREMLHNASPSDMKRQNEKGQSFLHIVLDMGDDNKHSVIDTVNFLQSVEILLQHNVDVNALDSKGRTPLDITDLHHDKGTAFYRKCAEMLIDKGAKRNIGNNISSPKATNQSLLQTTLTHGMSNLSLQNEKRKLRSCPKSHLPQAQLLKKPNSEVAVVGRYRYFNQSPIGSGAFSLIFVAIKDENVDSRSGTIECRAYALKRLDNQ